MTINRDIDNADFENGKAWAGDVDDTLNWISSQWLGRLQSVAGTNDITAKLSNPNGFASISQGASGVLVPANSITGAATLQLLAADNTPLTSAIPLRKNTGDALGNGDLAGGKAYPFNYDAVDEYFRILTPVQSQLIRGLLQVATARPSAVAFASGDGPTTIFTETLAANDASNSLLFVGMFQYACDAGHQSDTDGFTLHLYKDGVLQNPTSYKFRTADSLVGTACFLFGGVPGDIASHTWTVRGVNTDTNDDLFVLVDSGFMLTLEVLPDAA